MSEFTSKRTESSELVTLPESVRRYIATTRPSSIALPLPPHSLFSHQTSFHHTRLFKPSPQQASHHVARSSSLSDSPQSQSGSCPFASYDRHPHMQLVGQNASTSTLCRRCRRAHRLARGTGPLSRRSWSIWNIRLVCRVERMFGNVDVTYTKAMQRKQKVPQTKNTLLRRLAPFSSTM